MTPPPADSPIEQYLDKLMVAMSGTSPRQLRHLLNEAEAHLRDAAADLVAAGLSQHEAEQRAVAQFGAAQLVADEERNRLRPSWVTVMRQFTGSAVLLGSIGAIAVGVSGALAGLLAVVGGSRFVVDVRPGQHLSAADCARWLSQDPSAADCHSAAVADWINEVVGYRLALGVLGVLVLLAWYRSSRRRGRLPGLLPPLVNDAVAAAAFGVGAIATAGMAVDMVVTNDGRASGQWLSAAITALLAAAVFTTRLARRLRVPPDAAAPA